MRLVLFPAFLFFFTTSQISVRWRGGKALDSALGTQHSALLRRGLWRGGLLDLLLGDPEDMDLVGSGDGQNRAIGRKGERGHRLRHKQRHLTNEILRGKGWHVCVSS